MNIAFFLKEPISTYFLVKLYETFFAMPQATLNWNDVTQ